MRRVRRREPFHERLDVGVHHGGPAGTCLPDDNKRLRRIPHEVSSDPVHHAVHFLWQQEASTSLSYPCVSLHERLVDGDVAVKSCERLREGFVDDGFDVFIQQVGEDLWVSICFFSDDSCFFQLLLQSCKLARTSPTLSFEVLDHRLRQAIDKGWISEVSKSSTRLEVSRKRVVASAVECCIHGRQVHRAAIAAGLSSIPLQPLTGS
mmetsp:Transcript_2425/g.7476  ORF Transcript_2425/g.7476 Transcript_2425/m.7476 type:complete len:207 (-) Transcript_2425:1197-1817(-)